MSTYYFDTSALIKYYVTEAGTDWVDAIVEARDGTAYAHVVAFAKIGIVEAAAAVSRRHRMGDLSRKKRDALFARMGRDAHARFVTLGLPDELLARAARLTQAHPLRGYDAVHLASALALNEHLVGAQTAPVTFASADKQLCTVAHAEGLTTVVPA